MKFRVITSKKTGVIVLMEMSIKELEKQLKLNEENIQDLLYENKKIKEILNEKRGE